MTMPIIVGMDGSAPSLRAAIWAARESAIRGTSLRMLHVVSEWSYDVPLVPQPRTWGAEAEVAAREMLSHATDHVRANKPDLRVTADIIFGRTADMLVGAAEEAQLLVVGSRGRGGFAELLLGSVSREVAARAPCPVAVVREQHTGDRGEIVVGISGKPGQESLLDFAFREAVLRNATLRMVHTWVHPVTRWLGDLQPIVYDVDEMNQEEALRLNEAVAGWREQFPDVVVVPHVVHGHAAQVLIETSADADILLIGGRSGASALFGQGGTAHAVLHHSRVPVVVVRP